MSSSGSESDRRPICGGEGMNGKNEGSDPMGHSNRKSPAAALAMVLGMNALGMAATGPCDILATGGTPCVAAHSTTRALLAAYDGPLYQLRRLSDGQFKDVRTVSPGGIANSATQDSFCVAKGSCTISEIYDQSGKANHLKRSQGGAEVCKHQDLEAVADALPFQLGGHKVYGIKVEPDNNGGCTPPAGSEGTGYRLDKTTGIATADLPETMYMITSSDYQNSGCCFDYGNVETSDKDDGAATMEAIYFGGGAGWGHGGGSGPWVMADLENGIFSGSTNAYTGNTSVNYHYVTAILIGRSGGTYALLAGDAQKGALTTMWDGVRPNGYTKMKKQGAIVLGTGGDNSDHGKGYFFEGVMTTGAATIATMNSVQTNIVAAGYGSTTSLERATQHAPSPVSVRFDPSGKVVSIEWNQGLPGTVQIEVVDLRGTVVARLVDGPVTAGSHQVSWSTAGKGVRLLKIRFPGREDWSVRNIVLE
jgi:non-reducing end alpha-L-arabinofuranosidase